MSEGELLIYQELQKTNKQLSSLIEELKQLNATLKTIAQAISQSQNSNS